MGISNKIGGIKNSDTMLQLKTYGSLPKAAMFDERASEKKATRPPPGYFHTV